MKYDINKLKALRDNIDQYLEVERDRGSKIEDEVQKRVSEVVDSEIKPLLEEFKQYLDDKAESN